MTYHAIALYADSCQEQLGFIMGVDRKASASILKNKDLERSFSVDKVVRGKHSLGLVRGILHMREPDPLKGYQIAMQSLDGCFDDIEAGKDYSTLPALRDWSPYTMFIVNHSPDSVDLYTLSNGRSTERNIAWPIFSIRSQTYFEQTQGLLWYAPATQSYYECSVSQMPNRQIAENLVLVGLHLADNPDIGSDKIHETFHSVDAQLYDVRSDGITQLR